MYPKILCVISKIFEFALIYHWGRVKFPRTHKEEMIRFYSQSPIKKQRYFMISKDESKLTDENNCDDSSEYHLSRRTYPYVQRENYYSHVFVFKKISWTLSQIPLICQMLILKKNRLFMKKKTVILDWSMIFVVRCAWYNNLRVTWIYVQRVLPKSLKWWS